jgi:hypothetical protein
MQFTIGNGLASIGKQQTEKALEEGETNFSLNSASTSGKSGDPWNGLQSKELIYALTISAQGNIPANGMNGDTTGKTAVNQVSAEDIPLANGSEPTKGSKKMEKKSSGRLMTAPVDMNGSMMNMVAITKQYLLDNHSLSNVSSGNYLSTGIVNELSGSSKRREENEADGIIPLTLIA